ncbi:MAG: alpha/beta hydrolase [Planctomycetota bacterium JB042]
MSFAIRVILTVAGVAFAGGLLLALLLWIVLRLVRRCPDAYWRRVGRAHLWLVPAYVVLLPPLVLASLARWGMGTRGDERGYAGPRVTADGEWRFQSRESLDAERRGATIPPAVAARAAAREVRLTTADGLEVRGFLVEARESPPRFQAVLVHGLFRNALELERPAAWLHELGGDVLMLEMRNHGGSGRGAPGFGLREREDVLAAVRFLRARATRGGVPLLLYGVSLGSAAVLLAAPDVERLGALAVDAAIPELEEVYENLAGRRMGLPGPYRWLTLRAIELLARFDVDDVRPVDAAGRLDPDLPALVVAAGRDVRTPPDAVRRVYDALPTPAERKEFWADDAASHGKVFEEDPAAYRAALGRLVERMLATDG